MTFTVTVTVGSGALEQGWVAGRWRRLRRGRREGRVGGRRGWRGGNAGEEKKEGVVGLELLH